MLAVHGLWRADRRLALWVEDARLIVAAPEAPGEAGAAHPFALPAAEAATLLDRHGPALGWLASTAAHGHTELWLPSGGGLPSPSPELGSGILSSHAGLLPPPTTLRRYAVPGLLFDADEAAQLLGELGDPWHPVLPTESPAGAPAELICGASLRWLTAVHDLAWRTVRRGQVLPVLRVVRVEKTTHSPTSATRHRESSRPEARDAETQPAAGSTGAGGAAAWAGWTPVSDAAVQAELGGLAAACPPVCRAEAVAEAVAEAAEPGSGRSAATLLAEALECLVDREVRAALEDHAPARRRRGSGAGTPGSPAERWLAALTAPDGRLAAPDAAELAALEAELTAWHRSVQPPQDNPLRLCLRLDEPLGPDPDDPDGGTSDDHWRLVLLAQSAAEPSLVVTAADLWADDGDALAALSRAVGHPRERLRAELERASRCWPPLRGLLREAEPEALTLDRRAAHAFLREAAPALVDAGFGVLLPSWWERPPRLSMTLTARAAEPRAARRSGLLDRDAVVAFRWHAVLDGKPLSEADLAQLAAAKQPLIRLRGQWLEADPERIAAAVAFLDREGTGTMSGGAFLRTAVAPEPAAGGLPVDAIEADGPLRALLATRAATTEAHGEATWQLEQVTPPPGLRAVLRPHQQRGLNWLAFLTRLGVGGILADDMGLGKTVQTLALLAVERADRARGTGRTGNARQAEIPATLLVCPTSVVAHWQQEAAALAPDLRVHLHYGPGRPQGAALHRIAAGADLVVTTYAVARHDAARLRQLHWHRVVLDEAQHVKAANSQQYAAVRQLPARHRLALTGTPVENRLSELHALLDFVNPGLFGSAVEFRARYAIPIELREDAAVAAALRERIRPLVLRRLKSDPAVRAGLPRKTETTVRCRLTTEQASLYRAVVGDLLARIEETKGLRRSGLVLGSLTRLKQVCNHPAHLLRDGSRLPGRSGKLTQLEEILRQARANGEKALCFTQFAEFGALLRRHLTGLLGEEVLYLHGGTPRLRREEIVSRFQHLDGPGVLLLSLRAGGTGLNLTAASQVVHIDRWWNPAVEDQATDRAFRIGQDHDVRVHKLVCAGTIEERIDSMITAKRALARTTFEADDAWLAELSTDELRDLVTLRPDTAAGATS